MGLSHLHRSQVGGADRPDLIRGDLFSRVTTAFWLRDNQVVAGGPIRGWIGREVDADLQDPYIPLAELKGSAGEEPAGSR